jgi:hypothetical protein
LFEFEQTKIGHTSLSLRTCTRCNFSKAEVSAPLEKSPYNGSTTSSSNNNNNTTTTTTTTTAETEER